jgi:hypothetical protein
LLGINFDNSQNPTPNTAQNDLFALKLAYETAQQWSGNIGRQDWLRKEETNSSVFAYTYDPSDRLTNAYFGRAGNYGLQNISLLSNAMEKMVLPSL